MRLLPCRCAVSSRYLVGYRYCALSGGILCVVLFCLGAIALGFAEAAAGDEAMLVVSAPSGKFIPEEVAATLLGAPGIATISKYLVLRIGKYDVIGMEPGTRGLVLAKNSLIGVKIRLGRWFEVWEDHAAVIGRVYQEDFGEGPPEHGMKHGYTVGATIRLGERKIPVRVIGVYEPPHPNAASKIFVPLIKAQQWFDKLGSISYAVVLLSGTTPPEETVRALRKRLPPHVSVITFSRPEARVPPN